MSKRGFRNPKSHKSSAVRAEQFDRTLEGMNVEMSEKMARALAEYHVGLVEPRLKWLETPWWKYKSMRPPETTKRADEQTAPEPEEEAT